jgi:hypothetical protein
LNQGQRAKTELQNRTALARQSDPGGVSPTAKSTFL